MDAESLSGINLDHETASSLSICFGAAAAVSSEAATLPDAVTLAPRASKPKRKLAIRQKKPITNLEYKKAYDQRQFFWTCPICKTKLQGNYGSVVGGRRFTGALSAQTCQEAPILPEKARAWTCPQHFLRCPLLTDNELYVIAFLKVTKVKHFNP